MPLTLTAMQRFSFSALFSALPNQSRLYFSKSSLLLFNVAGGDRLRNTVKWLQKLNKNSSFIFFFPSLFLSERSCLFAVEAAGGSVGVWICESV